MEISTFPIYLFPRKMLTLTVNLLKNGRVLMYQKVTGVNVPVFQKPHNTKAIIDYIFLHGHTGC